MSLRDHVQRHAARQVAAQMPDTQRHRWQAVQVLAAIEPTCWGEAVAGRLWFLRWLYEHGLLVS